MARAPITVTIGVPVYNSESHLAEALDSIRSQTYENLEIIVSDNASTDRTPEICRSYAARDPRIRYERSEENRGLAWNYNRLIDVARGTFFKWLPFDDVMAPTFVERCVQALEEDMSVVLAVSQVQLIDEDGTPADFDQRLRESIARRGLHLVPRDSARNLSSSSPYKRFNDILLHKVWHYELYGLIRLDALRRTRSLGTYVGSDQVLLAELALLGRFVQIPEVLYENRYPSLDAASPRSPDLAMKMDPSWTPKVHFPQASVARGYLSAARRAPVGRATKARCMLCLVRKVIYPDNLAKLLIPGPNNYLGLDVTRLWRRDRRAAVAGQNGSAAGGPQT